MLSTSMMCWSIYHILMSVLKYYKFSNNNKNFLMIYFDTIIYVSILVCYVTAVCRVKLSYIPFSRRVGRQCITQIYWLCRIYYCYYCVIAVVRQLGTVFRSFSSSLTRYYYYFIFSIPFVGWHGLPFQENIYCAHF